MPVLAVWSFIVTAISTASRPKSVVELDHRDFQRHGGGVLEGIAHGVAHDGGAWSSVPFWRRSTSTIFLALSHAPPAFAMKMAANKSEEGDAHQVTDEEVGVEERQRERKRKDHDENIPHPFLGVFSANADDFPLLSLSLAVVASSFMCSSI